MKTRTSWWATISFLGGLATLAMVFCAGWALWVQGHPEDIRTLETGITEQEIGMLGWVSRVLCLMAIVPALGTLLAAVVAKGMIRESGGTTIGRGLYRAGILAAGLAMVMAFWKVAPGRPGLYTMTKERGDVLRIHATGSQSEEL